MYIDAVLDSWPTYPYHAIEQYSHNRLAAILNTSGDHPWFLTLLPRHSSSAAEEGHGRCRGGDSVVPGGPFVQLMEQRIRRIALAVFDLVSARAQILELSRWRSAVLLRPHGFLQIPCRPPIPYRFLQSAQFLRH